MLKTKKTTAKTVAKPVAKKTATPVVKKAIAAKPVATVKKTAAPKTAAKAPAKKVAVGSESKKPVVKKAVVKPAAKKTAAAKPVAKKTAVKAAAKKTATPVVKKAVVKPVAKKVAAVKKPVAAKPVAKKTAVKAPVKKTAAKKIEPAITKEKKGTTVKKIEPKKTATKKAEVKAPVAKKTAAPKTAAPKTAAPKAATPKMPTAKKVDDASHSFAPEYLVLMQKDPNWLQAFWEISESRLKKIQAGKEKLVLRLFDIASDLTVRRSKKRAFRDIEIPADARSWYVQNHSKDGGFHAAIGTLGSSSNNADGHFDSIIETGEMQTFSFDGIRPNTESMFFKASLGTAKIGGGDSSGVSSASAESWLQQLASSSESLFSGALSSGALGSNASNDSISYGKDFFLWVKTRLIVYGGTRPDAHLQVRGEPFPLNADGTFSLEMDLPDSTQIIPVFATDKDGDFPTTIVPIVVKRTE